MGIARSPFGLAGAWIVACAVGLACTGDDPSLDRPGTPDAAEAGTTDAPSSGSFMLRSPGAAIIAPNENIKVAVEIDRIGGFTGAVKIALQPIPEGIAAAPLTLTGDVTTGELLLTATASAKDTITKVQLVGTAEPGLSDTKDLPLVVRGVAGKRELTYGEKDGVTIIQGITPRAHASTADDGVLIASESSVVRLQADGKRDMAFGTGGKTDLKPPFDRTVAVRVAKDGKILVFVYTNDRKNVAVHRLLPSGAYDTTYGTDGVAIHPFAKPQDQPYVFGGDVDTDGRAVVGIVPGFDGTSIFVRFLPDGKIDTTFAAQNLKTTSAQWHELRISGATPIAFGAGFYDAQAEMSKYALALITSSSSAPKDLGGQFRTPDVSSATFDAKGRMLIAGNGSYSGPLEQTTSYATIIRANPDGTVDKTFGETEMVQDAFGNVAGAHARFDVALEESSGKVIAIGQRRTYPQDVTSMVIARYDEMGQPDVPFGDQGVVLETDPMVTGSAGGYLQTAPTIVVLRSYSSSSTLVARYWR